MTTQVWYLPTTTQAGKIPKLTQQVTREHEGPNADPHFHQLLRQKAFDESVLGNLINSETITLLTGKVSDPESLLLYVGFDTPGF